MYQLAKFIQLTKLFYQNTTKMKIKVQKVIEETHDLELPAYRKNSIFYYKIISESEAIQICNAKGSESIGINYVSLALDQAPERSNQAEFDQQFNEVFTILAEKING